MESDEGAAGSCTTPQQVSLSQEVWGVLVSFFGPRQRVLISQRAPRSLYCELERLRASQKLIQWLHSVSFW